MCQRRRYRKSLANSVRQLYPSTLEKKGLISSQDSVQLRCMINCPRFAWIQPLSFLNGYSEKWFKSIKLRPRHHNRGNSWTWFIFINMTTINLCRVINVHLWSCTVTRGVKKISQRTTSINKSLSNFGAMRYWFRFDFLYSFSHE